MSAATTPALDGLRERLDALTQARARVEDLGRRRRVAHRVADEREGALREVYASADGDDPDPVRVEEARQALDEARAEAEPAAWEGRDAGAQRTVLEAEREVERYARENEAELVAELTPAALAAGERLEGAWRELLAAEREWTGAASAWGRVLRALGVGVRPPTSPLAGLLLGLNERPLPPTPWRPVPPSLDPGAG